MTDPVTLLSRSHGEGRVTFRALREAGYTTIERVADSTPRELAHRAGVSLQTARRLRTGAKAMLAERLTERSRRPAGVRSSQKTPAPAPPAVPVFSEGLSAAEASILVQDNGSRIRRAPATPDPVSPPETKPSGSGRSTFWRFG